MRRHCWRTACSAAAPSRPWRRPRGCAVCGRSAPSRRADTRRRSRAGASRPGQIRPELNFVGGQSDSARFDAAQVCQMGFTQFCDLRWESRTPFLIRCSIVFLQFRNGFVPNSGMKLWNCPRTDQARSARPQSAARAASLGNSSPR